MTKRRAYFLVLWLPMLIPVIGIGVAIHAPFAAVLAWGARRRPTEELLAGSWKVPFQIAGWAAVSTTLFLTWGEFFDRIGPPRPLGAILTDSDTWNSLGVYTGLSFGVAIAYVCLGWLIVSTVGRSWPLDNPDDREPHSPSAEHLATPIGSKRERSASERHDDRFSNLSDGPG